MDREQLDDWCEKGILGLVVAILVYSPLAFGCLPQLELDYFVVVQWLAVAIALLWFARFFVNPKHRLLWPPVCWPVLGFMVYAVVRYAVADIEYTARQELLRVLVYGTIFFAVINNLHRQETTQIVGLVAIFLAMAISLYAIYQFLTASDYTWNLYKPDGYRKRGSGTFINPNHLAGYLGVVFPLALAFTLTGRFEPTSKIFLAYAALAIFAGIASTLSRGGWFGTGVGLVAVYIWLLRHRDYWKRALVTIGVFALLFGFFFLKASLPPERYERILLAKQVEDVRFRLWPPTVALWKDHAWFGVGPGHYDYRFRQYRPADGQLQARPERAHNDYLNTLADWGLLGAFLVLSFWTLFYYQVFRGWRFVQRSQNDLAAKRSNKSAFVAGGALGLLALLAHSFFDYNFYVPATAILAVIVMALVAAHYRFASERYWHTVRWALRLPLLLVLGALLVFLSWQTWQRSGEAYWLHRATQTDDNAVARAALQRALSFQPQNFETLYKIGETYRHESWQGTEGYQGEAEKALTWFQRSTELNPYYPHGLIRAGMCLDWLNRHQEAEDYFLRAEKLDPNGYYTEAHLGWHYFQTNNYDEAERRLQRSMSLLPDPKLNPIPHSFLKLIEQRRAEQPASASRLP